MKATVTKYTEKRLTIPKRSYQGVLGYDIDNNYPARVMDIVQNSGMGKTCVITYKKFINGKGFKDQKFANILINNYRLTPNKLLNKLAKDFSYHGGFAIHVNYNMLYELSEINFQPFGHVRKTTEDSDYPNMFAICKNWGQKNIKSENVEYIDKYSEDPAVIQHQVDNAGGWENYKGQIFYYSNEGEDYPMAIYDAVLEDMQTDSQAKIFKFRNVTTNFLASHMLIVDKMEAGDDERQGTRNDEKQGIVQQLEEYQGAEDAMKIMVVEKERPEQTFDLKKMDIQSNDQIYKWTEESVRDSIRQGFLIPSALLQTSSSNIGESKEIINATNYYNSITEDERKKLSESIEMLYKKFTNYVEGYCYEIEEKSTNSKQDNPANNGEITKLLADPALTSTQKKAVLMSVFNIDEKSATEMTTVAGVSSNSKTLAEKIGVGGTTSMISILTDPTLTPEQKKNSLMILFSLPEAEANSLTQTNAATT